MSSDSGIYPEADASPSNPGEQPAYPPGQGAAEPGQPGYPPPAYAPPAYAPPAYVPPAYDQPLPVCDYTGESDEPCEEPTQERRWSSAAVIVSAVLGAVVGGVLVAGAVVWALGYVPGVKTPLTAATSATTGTQGSPSAKISILPSGGSPDVAEAVAKKAVPSVVSVSIQQGVTDPFSGRQSYQTVGTGSGIIIRPDGYILTNNHVVDGADRLLVTVGVDDKVAKVVGTDPSTDLAVLKIDGSGFPTADVGSSKNLQVGQFVMAVGSPFGLEKTVTSGIISALQRSELVQGQNDLTTYTNLIQTDAAINPGNSGGALVDEMGKLVGVNTLIQSPTGDVGAAQSAGIGFAIPVDFAMSIADQLISTGHATHPYLGVSTQTVDENVASQFGLPVKSGALVRFVSPSSPADQGGIKQGDIIIKIGDESIGSVEDVFAATRQHKIGETVPVQLVRDDRTITVDVKLGSDASRQ